MQGMGIPFQVHEPFWTLTPPAGVERNPLKYFCAPNQATPDYVAAHGIKNFIAYGFLCCFDAVDPDNFAMWNMVQREDVQWLRENFLRVLEKLALNAIACHTKGEAFFCDDWASKRFANGNTKCADVRSTVLEVGELAIQNAIRRRAHHRGPMAEFKRALALVLHVRQGGESPIFASWF